MDEGYVSRNAAALDLTALWRCGCRAGDRAEQRAMVKQTCTNSSGTTSRIRIRDEHVDALAT
ncbi:hypothetical protein KIF59_14975 [Enterobacter cloacae subsp. cloacae]|nr:hypothetical protein [Enterobacter cloacae subsp. cloacae]